MASTQLRSGQRGRSLQPSAARCCDAIMDVVSFQAAATRPSSTCTISKCAPTAGRTTRRTSSYCARRITAPCIADSSRWREALAAGWCFCAAMALLTARSIRHTPPTGVSGHSAHSEAWASANARHVEPSGELEVAPTPRRYSGVRFRCSLATPETVRTDREFFGPASLEARKIHWPMHGSVCRSSSCSIHPSELGCSAAHAKIATILAGAVAPPVPATPVPPAPAPALAPAVPAVSIANARIANARIADVRSNRWRVSRALSTRTLRAVPCPPQNKNAKHADDGGALACGKRHARRPDSLPHRLLASR
jgi:hypothetical protein